MMSVNIDDITDARVEPTDVLGGGFQTELTEEQAKEHIATAHDVVEDRLLNRGMSEHRLARIELYLARHFIRVGPDRQVDDESAGPISRSYSGDYEHTNFDATAPGQQAVMLDSSETLGRETLNEFFTVG